MKEKGLRGPIRYGAECNFWKGGVDKIHKTLWRLIRDSLKYAQWRKAIFERDNYTCQECGQRGGRLHVDHSPYAFSVILNTFAGIETVEDAYKIEFLWDTENGRTLCEKCDQKYGNKEFTRTGETLFDVISRHAQQRHQIATANN
jgi:5-methylcytosine-specific restriction endonuclease McrA